MCSKMRNKRKKWRRFVEEEYVLWYSRSGGDILKGSLICSVSGNEDP